MADSDSGTHVTDISESFPDDFEPRKEGTRNSYFPFRGVSGHGTLICLLALCARVQIFPRQNNSDPTAKPVL